MSFALDQEGNHYIDKNGEKIIYYVTYIDTNEYYIHKEGLHINNEGHFDSEDRCLVIKDGTQESHAINKKQLIQMNTNIKEYINNKLMTLQNSITEIIPFGSIIMWAGLISEIPNGWVICDGQNGTPDLRSRFIIGTGKGNGLTERELHDIGGAETHKLTIEEMPSHSHKFKTKFVGRSCRYHGSGIEMSSSSGYANADEGAIFSSGSDKSDNNMPPFYALAFIMKTSPIPIGSNNNKPDLNNMVISNENKPDLNNIEMNNI